MVKGSLIDQPDVGVTDPTFMINTPTGLIAAEIEDWAPNAAERLPPSSSAGVESGIVIHPTSDLVRRAPCAAGTSDSGSS